jgi:ferredoxin
MDAYYMNKISFNDIVQLFDPKEWDVGVISAEQLLQCGHKPIKQKIHVMGADFTNSVYYRGLTNTIILIRDGHTWDYTHYEQSIKILSESNLKNWFQLYTNFKEAAIMAGLGVRARNSLVYSYKFGFDCHIAAIGFDDEIIDLPKNRRVNNKMWKRCEGCDDCRKACPVGAIHNEKEPYWLNSSACDNFIGNSDHPVIPSIKKFWHENVYPEIPKDVIDQIQKPFDIEKILGVENYPWDKNGYTYDGQVVKQNGKLVNVPFCRECTSQPRCSKWNGKYPYDDVAKQNEIKPIIFKRGWTKKNEKK